jgi:ATP-binding cassette, subfamily B, bacterial
VDSGQLLERSDSTQLTGKSGQFRLLPRGSRLLIALVFLLVLTEAAFNCFVPLSVRYFIETVLKTRDSVAFWSLLTVVAGALSLTLAAGFLRDFLFARLRSRSLAELRRSMFRRLQSLSMQFHDALDRRQMLERFSTDLAAVDGAFTLAISWGVLPFVTALLSTGLMVFLDWRIGIIAVMLWPWAMLAPRALVPRARHATLESRRYETGVLNVVEESLSAQALIRAFAIEHLGAAAFRTRNEALTRSAMKAGLWNAFVERFAGLGVLLEQVFVLGLSLWLVFSRAMTVGTMLSVQMLAALLGSSLLYLVEYLPELLAAQVAFEGIRENLHETAGIVDAPGARVLPSFTTEIVFSEVSLGGVPDPGASPERKPEIVFRDSADNLLPDRVPAGRAVPHSSLSAVNLCIPKGSYGAFVGASGAGKSSMLNLLMRFHDPAAGRVTIDGHDLRNVTQASLRAQMGVVLQDGFVFSSTLRENIRMGRPTATEEAIADAAREAGILEFIQAQPAGFDTPVGTSGIWLSAGMIQRLALARAILRKPPILLLDEISSALDPAEELALNRTLDRLAQSTTLISATHRLASVSGAGRIFVFDRGKIAEQGSHFELMAKNGAYANLWRKQAGFRFSSDGRHVDVDAQRLRKIPILEKLDESTLAELAPFFSTETFETGRDIVCQNDPGDKFYIIARGKVEIWRTEEQSGRSLCVNVLNDGDFFGEITLITGFPRTATVRTIAVTTCISLERGQFTKLIDRFPDLKRELSEIAVQRLRASSRMAAAGTRS